MSTTEILHEHAELGPSGADGWATCAGRRAAVRGLPDIPSVYAAEGTLYHSVLAGCLEFGLDPSWHKDKTYTVDGFNFVVDDEMIGHMNKAIDRVYELAAGNKLFVETRVDIAAFSEAGQFGTADVVIVCPDELIVWDNKYGSGISVSPVRNFQCILYALGAWDTFAWEHYTHMDVEDVKVRIIIDQPRARVHRPDGEEDDGDDEDPMPLGGGEWETTMGELLGLWAPFFRKRAEATHDPDAPRTPSVKACQFCRAKLICKERAKFALDQIMLDFDDMDSMIEMGTKMTVGPDPRSLTQEQRVFIAQNKDFAIRWWRDIHRSVLEDYIRGIPTPGVKAIRGRRGPRMWADPVEIEKLLVRKLGSAKAFVKKLISPTAAQELLDPKTFDKIVDKAHKGANSLVTQSEGRPILVDENDKRPALRTAVDSFDDEEDKLI